MLKKSVMKALGALFMMVALVIGTYMLIPREEIDRVNPFVPKEDLFVQINEEPVPDSLRYEYSLVGYNEAGEQKEITFGTGTVLKDRAFLRIVAKGSFVEAWEEVPQDKLPKNVASKF